MLLACPMPRCSYYERLSDEQLVLLGIQPPDTPSLLGPSVSRASHPVHGNEGELVLFYKGRRVKGAPLRKLVSADVRLGEVEAVGLAEEQEEVAVRVGPAAFLR